MSDPFTVQALVVSQALAVRVERLGGELVPEALPEGAVCLGLFAEEHLLSRFAAAPEEESMIAELGLFAEPRRLLLYGMAYPPGVQARLMALIPDTLFPDTAEPWEAASQSYEEAVEPEPEGPVADLFAGTRQLPVGDLVRYDAMRKYPDDLAASSRTCSRARLSAERRTSSTMPSPLWSRSSATNQRTRMDWTGTRVPSMGPISNPRIFATSG
jgi:hypothetical protein